MKITPIKTPVVHAHDDLWQLLKANLPATLPEKSILAITSKIVSLCEGSVVTKNNLERDDLVPDECDYYLPRELNEYHFCLSITRGTLVASAGIDESNADGNFVLYPRDIQKSVNAIRHFIRQTYKVKNCGVVMTDSHVLPLRWGTSGTAIGYSGFISLKNYVGTPDIFGRKLKVTRSNISEGLAAAAVVCMGEGKEQQPLALIEDVPFIEFVDADPSPEEIASLTLSIDEDIFSPMLKSAPWIKGRQLKSSENKKS